MSVLQNVKVISPLKAHRAHIQSQAATRRAQKRNNTWNACRQAKELLVRRHLVSHRVSKGFEMVVTQEFYEPTVPPLSWRFRTTLYWQCHRADYQLPSTFTKHEHTHARTRNIKEIEKEKRFISPKPREPAKRNMSPNTWNSKSAFCIKSPCHATNHTWTKLGAVPTRAWGRIFRRQDSPRQGI